MFQGAKAFYQVLLSWNVINIRDVFDIFDKIQQILIKMGRRRAGICLCWKSSTTVRAVRL
jgi:hypothetical protein